jgi:hypothetical protein
MVAELLGGWASCSSAKVRKCQDRRAHQGHKFSFRTENLAWCFLLFPLVKCLSYLHNQDSIDTVECSGQIQRSNSAVVRDWPLGPADRARHRARAGPAERRWRPCARRLRASACGGCVGGMRAFPLCVCMRACLRDALVRAYVRARVLLSVYSFQGFNHGPVFTQSLALLAPSLTSL